MKKCSTLATDQSFHTTPDSPPLTIEKEEMFRSCAMPIYCLVNKVRPQVLTTVSFCATRFISPTVEDEKKLYRILSFLLFPREDKFILRFGELLQLNAYVDSSFGIYDDGKSVTGVAIMLGQATIYFVSGNQNIVTRSSTESELVGISDALSQVLWTREYLISAGLDIGPAMNNQDNQSTIWLANKGRSTSERSRHIKIRHFFVSRYIESEEIMCQVLTNWGHGCRRSHKTTTLTTLFKTHWTSYGYLRAMNKHPHTRLTESYTAMNNQ